MNEAAEQTSPPLPIDQRKAALKLHRSEAWDTHISHRDGGSDHETSVPTTSSDFNDTILTLLELNKPNVTPADKPKYQSRQDEKRAVDYHQQYKLNPLREQQYQGGRSAHKEEFHSPWMEAIEKTPANAGRSITEESGPHPTYLRWLDKYNAEMHGRPNSTPITQEKLQNDPHLARILAGFALQDRVQEEVIEHGSNKVPHTYTSAWAQKPASVPTPAKPKRGFFGRAVNKVKGWFGFGKK